MPSRALVVDANILVRAVLGRRVREVIETYAGQVSFFVPEFAFAEAEEHRRRQDSAVLRLQLAPDRLRGFTDSLFGDKLTSDRREDVICLFE